MMREVACAVRSDRLDELLDALAPLLKREPIAITRPNGERFYLLSSSLFEDLRQPELSLDSIHESIASGASTIHVAQAADALMDAEHLRVRSGEFSEASWHIMRNRLDRHILPAFGELEIHEIDRKAVDALMGRLYDEKASATTQSQYLVIVRKLLKLAHQQKWIESIPELPKVRVTHKPRSALSLTQYKTVLRTAKTLLRSGALAPNIKTGSGERSRFWITPRYRQLPLDMYALIIFMVNGFMRPSDIKNLKHEHVEVVRGTHAYLRLQLPESKRHDRPIVSLQPAVRVYEMLKRHWQSAGRSEPGDWIFLPQEKTANTP
jgi:integrase